MAPAISIALMAVLILLAHFQRDAPRTYAAACFSAAPVIHWILFWETTGFRYYFSAAVFNLAVVALLNCIHPLCITIVRLQRIAFSMLLTNGFGAGLWYHYFEPTVYNWAFVALYGAACVELLRKAGPNVGNSGGVSIRFSRLGSVDFMRKIKPETKS